MFMILVFIVGAVCAVPYCFLTGWTPESQMFIIPLAGYFMFQWSVFADRAGVLNLSGGCTFDWKEAFRFKSKKRMVWPSYKIGLWSWTLIAILPILIHWTSRIVQFAGNMGVSEQLEKYRFVPSLFGCVLVVIGYFVWRIWIYPKELAHDMIFVRKITGEEV